MGFFRIFKYLVLTKGKENKVSLLVMLMTKNPNSSVAKTCHFLLFYLFNCDISRQVKVQSRIKFIPYWNCNRS